MSEKGSLDYHFEMRGFIFAGEKLFIGVSHQ